MQSNNETDPSMMPKSVENRSIVFEKAGWFMSSFIKLLENTISLLGSICGYVRLREECSLLSALDP